MTNIELANNWEKVLEAIKPIIPPIAYNTWFSNLKAKRIDEKLGILFLSADNDMAKDMLNKRYLPLTTNAIESVFGKQYSVSIFVEQKMELIPNGDPENHSKEFTDENWLNPKFTFENFIVGENNKFAHAAAVAVAEYPSESYNPLFLYGGSGLGKTHLMHAIGCYILKNTKFKKKVLYVSSEMFVNELISALGSGTIRTTNKTSEFRRKYRDVDVLMIDDIQFLEKKEQCQVEFFNTFNELYNQKKQIIISSDRPPTNLKTFDERLTSRLSCSMVADLTPPDLETRIAILLNNANNDNITVDEDLQEVINVIAEKFPNNIRELEGAFSRVVSFSELMNERITVRFAKEVLKEIFTEKDNEVNPVNIKKKVCKYFNIKVSDIESSNRARKFAYPRQISMFLCRELTDLSLPKIGEYFGGRDHTTVIHACNKISEEFNKSEECRKLIISLKEEIQG
jgi:chromosomal replication initiator protein